MSFVKANAVCESILSLIGFESRYICPCWMQIEDHLLNDGTLLCKAKESQQLAFIINRTLIHITKKFFDYSFV